MKSMCILTLTCSKLKLRKPNSIAPKRPNGKIPPTTYQTDRRLETQRDPELDGQIPSRSKNEAKWGARIPRGRRFTVS